MKNSILKRDNQIVNVYFDKGLYFLFVGVLYQVENNKDVIKSEAAYLIGNGVTSSGEVRIDAITNKTFNSTTEVKIERWLEGKNRMRITKILNSSVLEYRIYRVI